MTNEAIIERKVIGTEGMTISQMVYIPNKDIAKVLRTMAMTGTGKWKKEELRFFLLTAAERLSEIDD